MAQIGEPRREIIVQPESEPVRIPEKAPVPVREPERVPVPA